MSENDSAKRSRTRSHRGRRPRSRAVLEAKKVAPDVVELIVALQELIDLRYSSHREFLAGLAGRSRAEPMSKTTLSNEMSGEGHFRNGPSWEICLLIVTECAPRGRRLPELARIAGLFARANGRSRPARYLGPVFPTASDPLLTRSDYEDHLERLAGALAPRSLDVTGCPRRGWRPVVGVVGVAVALSIVATLMGLAVDVTVPLATVGLIAGTARVRHDWGPGIARTPLRRATHEPATVPIKMGQFTTRISTLVEAPEGFTDDPVPRWAQVPTSAVATRFDAVDRQRLSLFSRLPATTGLEPGQSTILRGTGTDHIAATCFNSYLYLAAECDDTGCECRPVVEWSLSDQRDVLFATGLLFGGESPFDGGSPYVVPEQPGGQWICEGSAANLEGITVVGIDVRSVTVMLRRLDSGSCRCSVSWPHASVHYHSISSRLVR